MSETRNDLVNIGDTVSFRKEDIDDITRSIHVEWRQRLEQRGEWFCLIDAELATYQTSTDRTVIPLFIQRSRLQEFIATCRTNENQYEFDVTERFRYGQDKEKTIRFLVFQDSRNEQYQHRFIATSAAARIAAFARAVSSKSSLEVAKVVSETIAVLQSIFGDKLRSF